jgi:lysozyme
MKKNEWIIFLLGVIVLTFLTMSYRTILKTFLPPFEGFSANPYWDYKQWSWGYGTRVPGSTSNPEVRPEKTITREQAMLDTIAYIEKDRAYLSALIKVPLNEKQWAALLSFSYNLGRYNADNLVYNINNNYQDALKTQWSLYYFAGGAPSNALKARRKAEWELWSS